MVGITGTLCMLKNRMNNMPFVGGSGVWQGVDQRAVLFGELWGNNGKVLYGGYINAADIGLYYFLR